MNSCGKSCFHFYNFFINFAYIIIKHFFSNKINNFIYTDNPYEFISNYFNKDISINALIGGPAQNITLAACLGEYDTFIISKYCEGYEGIYYQDKSNTYKKLEEEPIDYDFENV